MNKIPIVFAFDEGYAWPGSVAIQSLMDAKIPSTEYEVIVLCSGIRNATKRKIESIAPIKWIEIDRSFFDGWPSRWNTPTCYRLVMAEALKGYGKVIWSDCDVVFASDLSDLYNVDVSDWDWAAIPMENAEEKAGIHRHWNSHDTVFTPCCVVADMTHWREKGFADVFKGIAGKFDKDLAMLDLDAMNLAGARIKPLPLEYSVFIRLLTDGVDAPEYSWLCRMFGEDALAHAVENPKIIHFAGPQMKVWLRRPDEMPPSYRNAMLKSPLWDPVRTTGGVMAVVKAAFNTVMYFCCRKPHYRRCAGVYWRCR